jgi:acyl carrier protein
MDELDTVLLVQRALAARLRQPMAAIVESHEIERDLGLDGLDLLLIALQLEEDAGFEFPAALLKRVRTVADLVELVAGWLERASERVTDERASAAHEVDIYDRPTLPAPDTQEDRRKLPTTDALVRPFDTAAEAFFEGGDVVVNIGDHDDDTNDRDDVASFWVEQRRRDLTPWVAACIIFCAVLLLLA